jgi:hypothetical protein
MVFFSLILIIMGFLYIVFAYRDPPEAVRHFFLIPSIFVFFAEENRVKLGRVTTGAFLVLSGFGWLLWDIYHRIFGW